MAEFIFMKIDHTHVDPIKNTNDCYKRDDFVQCYEDGTLNAQPSPNSEFYIGKMPGLALSTISDHADPIIDQTDPDNPITIRRSKYYFDVDALTSQEQIDLSNDRWITIDQSRHDVLCVEKVI